MNLSNNWSFDNSCSFPLVVPIYNVIFPALKTLILNNIRGRLYRNKNKQKNTLLCKCCKGKSRETCYISCKNLFLNLFISYPSLKRLEIRNYLHLLTCNNYCFYTAKHFDPQYHQYDIIKQCLLQLNRRLHVLCTSRVSVNYYTYNDLYNNTNDNILDKESIQNIKELMIKECVDKINLDSTIEDRIEFLQDTFQYDSISNIYEIVDINNKYDVVLVINSIFSLLMYKRIDEI